MVDPSHHTHTHTRHLRDDDRGKLHRCTLNTNHSPVASPTVNKCNSPASSATIQALEPIQLQTTEPARRASLVSELRVTITRTRSNLSPQDR
ncbi:hypothetical protein ElyMa_000626200 [Elysia marginata]|uniref:Uncharacterized protein n=1 Tax=Elysia marginata TaxID=1093978 RepID=A0AAV4GBK6_9GAST|nr:hypothetical protein ElyMa_000626200 [Elysia marginata]